MLTIENESDFEINTAKLDEIVLSLTKKDVECLFVNSEDMRELNVNTRGLDKTTDVLSFPLEELPYVPLGSIVINAQLAKASAAELGHTLEDECALLFIHGMLHLLSFDHESDNGEMREKEEELIAAFALPKSLICRNS
ncbi:MAG: rRNA maturation RNase YbeY [Campylobacteraceae bacterium]|jgi:probable rRNA maturation factor|nr:rRNA maturation RNase YbeY [Campylobacteraceae bacterium]